MKAIRTIGLLLGLGMLLAFSGCFTTKFTLIDPATAKVDKAYIGNWNNDMAFNSAGREAGLIIRNIDDKQYYVEWKLTGESSANSVVRAVGFTTDVKGATFAQLRGLEDDGSVAAEWLLLRLELKGDKLALRQLDEDFFKGKPVDSAAQLRQILENNLDNPAMYDQDEAVTVTRVARN